MRTARRWLMVLVAPLLAAQPVGTFLRPAIWPNRRRALGVTPINVSVNLLVTSGAGAINTVAGSGVEGCSPAGDPATASNHLLIDHPAHC